MDTAPIQAVLIAGGRGTRLAPLTDTIPKPLVRVGGKPIMQWVLEHMRRQGVESVVVSVAHMGEQIEQCFGAGDALGMRLEYVREATPMGTGAWAHMLDWERVREPLVVANADNMFWVNISRARAVHARAGGPLTLIGTSLLSEGVSGAEVIVPGVEGVVADYVMREHSAPLLAASKTVWVSSGWYIVDPVFPRVLSCQPPCSMERDHILAVLRGGARVGFYPSDEPWFDTGTHERLKEVETFLQNTTSL